MQNKKYAIKTGMRYKKSVEFIPGSFMSHVLLKLNGHMESNKSKEVVNTLPSTWKKCILFPQIYICVFLCEVLNVKGKYCIAI